MGTRVLMVSLNQYDFPYPVFPLGAAQVTAALRQAGHVVRFVDCNLDPGNVSEWVTGFQPEVIGISLRNIDDALIQKRETFFESLIGLVRELRHHTAAPVVLGGSGYSIFPRELLEASGADYGIEGEGETPFLALIDALNNGREASGLPGLVHRRGTTVVVNPRTRTGSAADIPMPELSPGLAEYYLRRSSMLNVQTQRGCALKCCYCTYPLLEGRNYRQRPPEAVVDELARAHAAGARYMFIVDSVFNTSQIHVAEICEEILRRELRLNWCCFLRPKRVTSELVRLMARAGLAHVEFGSDSFSDPVLETYGKGLVFDDILEASRATEAAGVDHAHFLILGGPGETEDTLEETFTRSKLLPHSTLMARVGMRVYPGTPLHDRLSAAGPPSPLPDLLTPYYHIEPPLEQDHILARLEAAAAEMPNWIYGDPPVRYQQMAERLRARGVIGPLWSYFAMMQRLGGLASGPA